MLNDGTPYTEVIEGCTRGGPRELPEWRPAAREFKAQTLVAREGGWKLTLH